MARQGFIVGVGGFGQATFLTETVSQRAFVNGVFIEETAAASDAGALRAQDATMSGTGTVSGAGTITGDGVLVAQSVALSGTGTVSGGVGVTGTGALVADGVTAHTNFVSQSYAIDNAWWTKTNAPITVNAVVAPDGTSTADTLTDNATLGEHVAYGTLPSLSAGPTFTASCYAKAGTGTWLKVHLTTDLIYHANFNLVTGTIGNVTANTVARMEDVGNGWYRCSITTAALGSTRSPGFYLRALPSDATGTFVNYSGSGQTWHLWGAQVETGSILGPYVPTIGAPIGASIPALFGSGLISGAAGALVAGPPSRTNQLLQSQAFDNASWFKSNASSAPNGVIAPDGTTTGDSLVDNGVNTNHFFAQNVSFAAGQAYTLSVYALAGTSSYVRLNIATDTQYHANFNLYWGTVGYTSLPNGATAVIEDAGDGWYRCSLTTGVHPSGGTGGANIYAITTDSSGTSYAGAGTSRFLWGAQFEAGDAATPYIPTTTAAVSAPVPALFGSGRLGKVHGAWDREFVDDANPSYSNDDRTVTMFSTAYPFSTDGYMPGTSNLVYAEITAGLVGTGSSPYLGVGDRGWSNQAAIARDGGLYNFASYSETAVGGPFVTGAVIGIAYKASTNEAWFRENNGGWNKGGTDDPVTGLGGIPVGGTAMVYVTAEGSAVTELTINTGTVAFAYAIPSGFSPWYAPAASNTLTPSLHVDPDTFYTQTLAASGAVTLTPALYTNPDTFYTHTISVGSVGLTPALYVDPDTFYTHVLTSSALTLTPALYVNPDTFNTHTLAASGAVTLIAPLYANPDTFNTHTITATGNAPLTAALYVNPDTFYTHVLSPGSVTLTPARYDNLPDTFYTPTVTILTPGVIQPTLYTDPDTLRIPTITATGSAPLTATLYVNPDTFYTPVLSPGTVTLTAALYTNPDTFYTHTVTASGTLTLTPPLHTDPDTFYTHALSPGAVTLTATLYVNPDTFYTHVLSPGAVTLTAALYVNPDTFNTHTITISMGAVSPALYVDPDTFYAHTVIGTTVLAPARYDDPDFFYQHTLSPGPVTLTVARYTDPDTFYTHAVVKVLSPPLYTDPDIFRTVTVSASGAAPLRPERYVDPDIFYQATIAVFYVDTEVICAPYEDRRMHVLMEDRTSIVPAEPRVEVAPPMLARAEYRAMRTPMEYRAMAVLQTDHAMDSQPRRRAC